MSKLPNSEFDAVIEQLEKELKNSVDESYKALKKQWAYLKKSIEEDQSPQNLDLILKEIIRLQQIRDSEKRRIKNKISDLNTGYYLAMKEVNTKLGISQN